jgi:hypothetical protein
MILSAVRLETALAGSPLFAEVFPVALVASE